MTIHSDFDPIEDHYMAIQEAWTAIYWPSKAPRLSNIGRPRKIYPKMSVFLL